MCGICGFVGLDDKNLISEMMDALSHRGPDDEGMFVDGEVCLGHRRLSIIDLETGHQPMSNEDGTIWIVYNGELYNHLELRKEMESKGHRYATSSDTETIVHLYEEYGPHCVAYMNGMFSFTIWDSNKRKLFLARDRAGIKPLYYTLRDGVLYFASEIKSILKAPEIKREVDPHALYDYFVFSYILAPRTIFQGIKKLPPGHTLEYEGGKLVIKQYWDLVYPKKKNPDELSHQKNVLKLLTSSVEKGLMGDVPLGAFLSGGIDSSGIVALMSRFVDKPIETFIVGFNGAPRGINELSYAREVSEKFNTNHHEVMMDASDAVKILPSVVWHLDEPLGDYAVMPTYFVSEFARKRVKVVLTGEGADEIFGGYNQYVRELKHHRIRLEGKKSAYIKSLTHSHISESAQWQDWLDPDYCGMIKILTDAEREEFFTKKFKAEIKGHFPPDAYGNKYKTTSATHTLDKMLYADFKVWLPDNLLMKVDKMSMAHSLEARVPYLDYRLVEYSAKIPWNMKVRDSTLKYILKKSLKSVLPEKIIKRKKHGFTVPLQDWFKGELGEYTGNILDIQYIKRREYFNQDFLKKIPTKSNRKEDVDRLWHLLMLELWFQSYIDKDL